MKTVRLGKTGLEVSRVGMGGIPLTRPTEAEAIKLVQRALDLGVNFIDTAFGYGAGMSEERIGKAIAGRRDQVIIATKGWDPEHIDVSLKRLNTDYIDLWQFHGINSFEDLDLVLKPGGPLEGARKAMQAGKVRHLGFSSHNLDVALKAAGLGVFETVQFPFNFVSDEAASKLIPLARERDLGFIAMKPLAGGRLRKNASLSLKYLLQFDSVIPDPGIEKVEEIEEIVALAEQAPWKLSEAEQQEIAALRAQIGPRFCHQCEYCMPCPEGVIIYGMTYLPILYELWPADWFFSWGYVQDSVASAHKCIQCGECEKKCPYQLPIREMIAENLAFFERVQQEYQAARENR